MAASRYYLKRLRRITSAPLVQLTATFALIFFGLQWIINHNHDLEDVVGPVGRHYGNVGSRKIDWSGTKYVQFVSSPEQLCNAVMLWNQMEEIGGHPQRIMFYPSSWNSSEVEAVTKYPTPIARLLQTAEQKLYVQLQPLDVLDPTSNTKWTNQYLKLLAFNLTSMSRVLVLDPASLYLQNMDELFLFPKAPVAIPHIYTGSTWGYSTQLMLITPSTSTFDTINRLLDSANQTTTDLSLLTQVIPISKITRIPQRPYLLLSSSFRDSGAQHKQYLAPFKGLFPGTTWDPDYMLRSVKLFSFSENSFGQFPHAPPDTSSNAVETFPPPWEKPRQELVNRYMPDCVKSEWFGNSDCSDRRVWLSLYRSFADRREGICGLGFEMMDEGEVANGNV